MAIEEKLKADVSCKPSATHNFLIGSDEGLTLETSAYKFTSSTPLINPNFCVLLPRLCSTTVSLETKPLYLFYSLEMFAVVLNLHTEFCACKKF